MKPAVPLSEFMPYGAPELLESRQRHLSQALVLASVTALTLYAVIRVIAPWIVEATVPPASSTIDVIIDRLPPPPLVSVVPSKPEVPVQHHAPDAGLLVPVPDAVAPLAETPVLADPNATGAGKPSPLATSEVGPAESATETLPPFGTWVYVERLPEVVKEVKPSYPDLPLRAGVEGLVMVHVLIGTDGRVREARVDRKVHVLMLDEAALEAARQWVFTPGLAQDRPVACWTAIPFRFRLH